MNLESNRVVIAADAVMEAETFCTEAQVDDHLEFYRAVLAPCLASVYAVDARGNRKHLDTLYLPPTKP